MGKKEKLLLFIQANAIDAEVIEFEGSVATSHHSIQTMNVPLSSIAKSILFEDEHKQLYSIIVRGSEKVDREKVKSHFGVESLRLVPFDEVIHRINYPAGGVPPFGYQARFVVSGSFDEKEIVYAGGGSTHSILKTTIAEIKKVTNAPQLDVSLTQ